MTREEIKRFVERSMREALEVKPDPRPFGPPMKVRIDASEPGNTLDVTTEKNEHCSAVIRALGRVPRPERVTLEAMYDLFPRLGIAIAADTELEVIPSSIDFDLHFVATQPLERIYVEIKLDEKEPA